MTGCRSFPTLLLLRACVLLGVWLNCIATAHQGGCRRFKFLPPENGHYLEGHVFLNLTIGLNTPCHHRCVMERECVSVNIGPAVNDKIVCELSNSDHLQHPQDLKPRHDWTYRGTENPCVSKPCLNNGKCLTGHTDKKYLCVCYALYTGENCEQQGAFAQQDTLVCLRYKGVLQGALDHTSSMIVSNVAVSYLLRERVSVKSRSYVKMIAPLAESGNYVINPEGGMAPFTAYCNMTNKNGAGVTVISHDSESKTLVDGCEPAGCYSRDIHYTGASLSQLASLTRVSSHCEQFVKFECYNVVMLRSGYAWWVSRDSTRAEGGASPGSGKCACGMTNSCADPVCACNCDANVNVWHEDNGLLTDKTKLPVKQLRFGKTGSSNEHGYHKLGKLKCYGIV